MKSIIVFILLLSTFYLFECMLEPIIIYEFFQSNNKLNLYFKAFRLIKSFPNIKKPSSVEHFLKYIPGIMCHHREFTLHAITVQSSIKILTFFIEVENFLLNFLYGNACPLKLLQNRWIDKVKIFFIFCSNVQINAIIEVIFLNNKQTHLPPAQKSHQSWSHSWVTSNNVLGTLKSTFKTSKK